MISRGRAPRSSTSARTAPCVARHAPNDFTSLSGAGPCLVTFQDYCQRLARPFEWKFTRAGLGELLARCDLPAAA